MPFGDLPYGVSHLLFAATKVLVPLVPHLPQILPVLVLLKVKYQSSHHLRLKLLSHVAKYVLQYAALAYQTVKTLVKLLTNVIKQRRLFLKPIFKLTHNRVLLLRLIQTHNFTNLQIYLINIQVMSHIILIGENSSISKGTVNKILLKVCY